MNTLGSDSPNTTDKEIKPEHLVISRLCTKQSSIGFDSGLSYVTSQFPPLYVDVFSFIFILVNPLAIVLANQQKIPLG